MLTDEQYEKLTRPDDRRRVIRRIAIEIDVPFEIPEGWHVLNASQGQGGTVWVYLIGYPEDHGGLSLGG